LIEKSEVLLEFKEKSPDKVNFREKAGWLLPYIGGQPEIDASKRKKSMLLLVNLDEFSFFKDSYDKVANLIIIPHIARIL
jgi:hypothetical protein